MCQVTFWSILKLVKWLFEKNKLVFRDKTGVSKHHQFIFFFFKDLIRKKFLPRLRRGVFLKNKKGSSYIISPDRLSSFYLNPTLFRNTCMWILICMKPQEVCLLWKNGRTAHGAWRVTHGWGSLLWAHTVVIFWAHGARLLGGVSLLRSRVLLLRIFGYLSVVTNIQILSLIQN